jgi:ABC-2 type transport system ATP-binding protein
MTADLGRVGDVALAAGLPVHELRVLRTDLERLFLELTEAPEHRNRNLAGAGGPLPGGAPVADGPDPAPSGGTPAGPAPADRRHTDVPAPAEETR